MFRCIRRSLVVAVPVEATEQLAQRAAADAFAEIVEGVKRRLKSRRSRIPLRTLHRICLRKRLLLKESPAEEYEPIGGRSSRSVT